MSAKFVKTKYHLQGGFASSKINGGAEIGEQSSWALVQERKFLPLPLKMKAKTIIK